MSDEPIRPEVVEAIHRAVTTGDPTALEPLSGLRITPAERTAVDDLILSSLEAGADHRDRVDRAWSLLIRRGWESPPSWEQLFDEVTPEVQVQLGELYDALPDGARAEYDRRYGRPDL
jgi:hypothetical protein